MVGQKKLIRKAEPPSKWSIRWPRWTGFRGRTVWDWLHLVSALAIPVAVAVAGFWFTAQQNALQQKIEDRRAEAEQELAAQRAQDEALQTYLGQVGTLLLKEDLPNAKKGSKVITLARARTLTVLGRLGPDRKRTVIEFLYEASLINGDNPAISLNNANLSGIDLSSRYLKDRRITGDPNLEGINLRGADLRGADLSGANINDGLPPDDLVNVSKADTSVVSLQGADLTQADLSGADLSSADLSGAKQLLSGADLSGVHLSNADLKSAVLPPRGLPDVDLSGADLRGADTLFITPKKLAQQAKSLEGATMPNGQKYEEWLKDKKGQ